MDPNVTLAAMLACARAVISREAETTADAVELAHLVEELDDWLCRGGFTPARWQPQPQPEETDP